MPKRRLLSLLLVAMGGCAHASTPVSVAPTVDALPAVREIPIDDPCVPALEGAVDLARIAALRANVLPDVPPELADVVADVLELPADAFVSGRVLEERGLDRSGTARFVVCAPDPTTHARVRALARLAPEDDYTSLDTTAEAELRRIFAEGGPSFVAVRIELPIGDAARLRAFVDSVIAGGMVAIDGPPSGYDTVRIGSDGTQIVGLSHTSDTLLIEWFEVPLAPDDAPGSSASAARALGVLMRAGRPGRPTADLATEGDVAHLVATPLPLAELNLLVGLGRVLEAVEHLDPSTRAQMLGEGAHEASRSLVLAEDEHGPYFDRLSVRLGVQGTIELRAEAARDDVLPADAAFHPAHGLTVAATGTLFAASPRFLLGFPLPGERGGEDGSVERLARLAGGIAPLYAAPHVAIGALRRALIEEAGPRSGEAAEASLARFEELAVVETVDRRRARVGLVAEGEDARAAACAYYADPRVCLARLREGRPLVADGEHAVMLARVDGRALVVDARTPDDARRIARAVSVGSGSSPVRLLLTDAGLRALDFAEVLPGVCGGTAGTVRREDRTLVFTLAHDACRAATSDLE